MGAQRIVRSLAFFLIFSGMAFSGEHAMTMPQPDAKWGKQDDAAFLSGMIVHHQGALKMSEAVVNMTKDPAIATWSKAIIKTQQEEITYMQSLLDAMGLSDPAAAEMMKKDMDQMLAMKESQNPNVNFLLLMIPHHASAVDMSLLVLVGSQDPKLRKLAKDIIIAQTKEIAEFRDWLDKNQDHK